MKPTLCCKVEWRPFAQQQQAVGTYSLRCDLEALNIACAALLQRNLAAASVAKRRAAVGAARAHQLTERTSNSTQYSALPLAFDPVMSPKYGSIVGDMVRPVYLQLAIFHSALSFDVLCAAASSRGDNRVTEDATCCGSARI